MKSIQIFGLVALFSLSLTAMQAQKPLKVRNGCNYYGKETEQEYYQFEPTSEARQIVNELLASSGLSANSFQLKESNCANALATTVDGVRFILYNPDFLRKFKQDAATKWAAYGALAHEIGHHLNGHNLSETDPSVRRQFELEADKFAGNLLFHLHATVDESQAGIKTIPLEGQTNTHPSKSARLVATTNGWTAALDLSLGRQPKMVNQPRVSLERPIKPTPTKVEMPTFTEVSDRLMENKLIGNWNGMTSFHVFHFRKLGSGGMLLYNDNREIIMGTDFEWAIKAGHLLIGNKILIEDKYEFKFINDNTI
jgi:hypothetical protein